MLGYFVLIIRHTFLALWHGFRNNLQLGLEFFCGRGLFLLAGAFMKPRSESLKLPAKNQAAVGSFLNSPSSARANSARWTPGQTVSKAPYKSCRTAKCHKLELSSHACQGVQGLFLYALLSRCFMNSVLEKIFRMQSECERQHLRCLRTRFTRTISGLQCRLAGTRCVNKLE